jgi:hypothetical protein
MTERIELDLRPHQQVERLIEYCQHLHDAAYELDPVADSERIEVIDQAISRAICQINKLKAAPDYRFTTEAP